MTVSVVVHIQCVEPDPDAEVLGEDGGSEGFLNTFWGISRGEHE